MTAVGRGHEVGTVEILQDGPRRGVYTATFDEDVMGARSVHFEYGCKALNPAELLMRAICWAYHDTDVIGPVPKLVLLPALKIDSTERFHLAALDEPALTEFQRYQTLTAKVGTEPVNNLPRAKDYPLGATPQFGNTTPAPQRRGQHAGTAGFPVGATTHADMQDCLERVFASGAAVEALKEAWKKFQASVKRAEKRASGKA